MKYKETTTVIEKDAQGNIVKETTTTIEREYNYWTNPYTPTLQPFTSPNTFPATYSPDIFKMYSTGMITNKQSPNTMIWN